MATWLLACFGVGCGVLSLALAAYGLVLAGPLSRRLRAMMRDLERLRDGGGS